MLRWGIVFLVPVLADFFQLPVGSPRVGGSGAVFQSAIMFLPRTAPGPARVRTFIPRMESEREIAAREAAEERGRIHGLISNSQGGLGGGCRSPFSDVSKPTHEITRFSFAQI